MLQQDQADIPQRRANGVWRALVSLILTLALLGVGFAAGVTVMWFVGPQVHQAVAALSSTPASAEKQVSREESLKLLLQVWSLLEKEYIDPEAIKQDKMVYGAAEGMVATLGDPHTTFVEPQTANILEQDMQGSFEGIGASVDMVDGKLTIVRPLPNSPALKAGLLPGDVVLEVDGQALTGKTLIESISLIRGPHGTTVNLRIQRKDTSEPFMVALVRDKVESPTVESKMLEDNQIAYVRLAEFNAISKDKVHAALADLLRNKPKGLIFDLRGNPGGYLQMAIEIASEFLPRDTLVVSDHERDQPAQEFRVTRAGLATDIPLVVLINGGSASASEIVAGAIRDNQRGKLIGEQSFGKGSVQNTHKLEDGSSLRVTIARWYLPGGTNLEEAKGIPPDIQVPYTKEDVAAGQDPQLQRAVDYLLSGK
jgi:carboxyl-terminal processing protease